MNTKLFSKAISEIDTKYIEEAIQYQGKNKKHLWIKLGVIAACLAFAVYAGIQIFPKESLDETELPLLTIDGRSESMGFEGYMANDISELVNANPWNENMKLSTMPVYKNPLTYNYSKGYIISKDNAKKTKEFLLEIASRFGINKRSLTITDDAPDKERKAAITEKLEGNVPEGYFEPTRLIAKAEGFIIEAEPTGTATISFEPAVSLPDNYNFTHSASYEETIAAAEYLKDKYKDFIGFDNPQINIYGGDYDIYHQQHYRIEFFDGNGNNTERIINYNFYRVEFCCDDDGKLFLARVYQPDLSQKAGDYPIITRNKATELLLNGNYITTVPYEMPDSDYIARVELIYRAGDLEQYYMPYYRFYVELPDERTQEDYGLKTYGAYYVPAVEETYISNMPIWDGSFN